MSYSFSKENKIYCTLCPNECVIKEGHTGICKVRLNKKGELDLPFYGKLSAVSIDPIEKKPLYHFYPGSRILSVGFYGCSFHCPFCQNYNISQSLNSRADTVEPEELVKEALKNSSFGIAYTYSEPLIHFEYLMDTAAIARDHGLKNIIVSNGYLNKKPAIELLNLIDAANIDLKTFNPDFYKDEIGGKLNAVLSFIEIAAEKTELEITTLVIPGKNDSIEEIEEIARFISSLNKNIPLHLSRYYPTYKYTIPETKVKTIIELKNIAEKHLNYVYAGNVGLLETNTVCPICGTILIRRSGYNVTVSGITDGRCIKCGTEIPVYGT